MRHNSASTARAHSTFHSMSTRRSAKRGGAAQTTTEECAVRRQAMPICQAATETSQSTEDIRDHWADDGGQNTITLMDDAQSI